MSEEQYLKIESWLKSIDSRLSKIECDLASKPKANPPEFINKITGVEKLAHHMKSTPEDLLNIVSFEEDEEFTFIFEMTGKSEPDKQLRATLCLLTVSNYCYAKDEILSKTLTKKLQLWGIKSLSNISKNLKKHMSFIVMKGKAGSSNFSYKITVPGLREGIKILNEIIDKDGKE